MQRINDRGVYIDEKLCNAANKIVDQTTSKLNQELARITDYEVSRLSNTSELIRFVRKHGFDADSVAKDKVIDLLVRDDLPLVLRRALEIRQEGAKTIAPPRSTPCWLADKLTAVCAERFSITAHQLAAGQPAGHSFRIFLGRI